MTAVHAVTGEIVEVLTEEQARRLIARINGTAAEMIDLIEHAWLGRAWVALSYPTWDALCEAEIQFPNMDRDRRREVVGSLRQIGMSTRAIGSAVGVDQRTVAADLRGAENSAPPEITGTDGKTYSSSPPPGDDGAVDFHAAPEESDEDPAPRPTPSSPKLPKSDHQKVVDAVVRCDSSLEKFLDMDPDSFLEFDPNEWELVQFLVRRSSEVAGRIAEIGRRRRRAANGGNS